MHPLYDVVSNSLFVSLLRIDRTNDGLKSLSRFMVVVKHTHFEHFDYLFAFFKELFSNGHICLLKFFWVTKNSTFLNCRLSCYMNWMKREIYTINEINTELDKVGINK